ncbi:saccharopine dehydrogenase NADP-binding domain-containing protein [Streptomyces sp. NPDC048172]|uniref:saccharopine dehydrogenase NADP-binding domain-containing protein n=1 Tax=Streptomyces sp. NPDC048172 TaxID=3365505 RepID=UPI00371FDFFF
MRDTVLVLGGYGAVGAPLTRILRERLPGRVLPAGRRPAASGDPGAVRADVRDPESFTALLVRHRVAVVVLCVEPPDAGITRLCLERGVHVVDVNATPRLLAATEALHGTAVAGGASALVSVGVAPGLTNLLARRAHREVGGAERLDLAVLLGTGEAHGNDALRWTLESLGETAKADGARPARSRVEAFPLHGRRRAHPFPFSDQHALRTTLGVPEVTTRLCLDSRAATAALFALRRPAHALAPLLERMPHGALGAVGGALGGDAFALRAEAVRGERRLVYALTGREQSRVTAQVAAHATRAVLDGAARPGVHHLDQVLPGLVPDGARLWRRDTDGAAACGTHM